MKQLSLIIIVSNVVWCCSVECSLLVRGVMLSLFSIFTHSHLANLSQLLSLWNDSVFNSSMHCLSIATRFLSATFKLFLISVVWSFLLSRVLCIYLSTVSSLLLETVTLLLHLKLIHCLTWKRELCLVVFFLRKRTVDFEARQLTCAGPNYEWINVIRRERTTALVMNYMPHRVCTLPFLPFKWECFRNWSTSPPPLSLYIYRHRYT